MNMRDRQCRKCVVTFKGGPRAWYCPACRYERRKKASREHKRRERRGLTRKIGSTDKCSTCENNYIVSAGLQKLCPDCRPIEYAKMDLELSLKYYEENKEVINPRRNKDRRIKRGAEVEMIKKICVASDCNKEFIIKMPHSKYCSDQCRSREHKRETYRQRIEKDLCPQCGGEMITPISTNDKAPNYCKKCQDNFQRLYTQNKGAGRS